MRASANVSYKNAAKDIHKYTGISISASAQQRIVQRYEFPELACGKELSEISLDGGKVRLRTETKGELCRWKDYKAICINKEIKLARLGENEVLIDWVNHQKLADPLTCLGDGHPGIWKIVREFNCPGERREILDWFHLIENLYKVGGSLKRLKQAETLLWSGRIDKTLTLSLHLKLNKLRIFVSIWKPIGIELLIMIIIKLRESVQLVLVQLTLLSNR